MHAILILIWMIVVHLSEHVAACDFAVHFFSCDKIIVYIRNLSMTARGNVNTVVRRV